MTALRARLFKGEGEATARPAKTTVRSWEALKCMFAVVDFGWWLYVADQGRWSRKFVVECDAKHLETRKFERYIYAILLILSYTMQSSSLFPLA